MAFPPSPSQIRIKNLLSSLWKKVGFNSTSASGPLSLFQTAGGISGNIRFILPGGANCQEIPERINCILEFPQDHINARFLTQIDTF
jgi:hypothetical protein